MSDMPAGYDEWLQAPYYTDEAEDEGPDPDAAYDQMRDDDLDLDGFVDADLFGDL
jgi:hypothetical protein